VTPTEPANLRVRYPFPARGRARRGTAAAFTLLELLLSLFIASVVAVTLFSSLSIAFRARRNTEAALAPARSAELAMQIVREDLESALPPRGTLAGTFYSNDLADDRGLDSDEVVFSAATPGPLHQSGTGDVKRVVVAVMKLEGTGEHVLVRRVYGNLLSPVVLDPDDEILCRNVGSFNLRFFDGTLWWDSWDASLDGDEVPVAVEVTLELEPTGDAASRSGASAAAATWPRFVRVIQLSCAGQGTAEEESDTGSSESSGSGDTNQPGGPNGPGGPGGPSGPAYNGRPGRGG
jgi:type II secretory pathway pseudopilin PulG